MRALPGTLSHFRVEEKLGCVLAVLACVEEKQNASAYLFPLHLRPLRGYLQQDV